MTRLQLCQAAVVTLASLLGCRSTVLRGSGLDEEVRLVGLSTKADPYPGRVVSAFCAARPSGWAARLGSPGQIGYGACDVCEGGIDSAPVVFSSGHGKAGGIWEIDRTAPNAARSIKASDIRLGDEIANGKARYFFQCSCRVFAHGPGPDFTSPGDYENGKGQKNAVLAWKPAFGEKLRLACGLSTDVAGNADELKRIWTGYLSARLDVADAFILGLADVRSRTVPVCLAPGGGKPEQSALADREFVFTDRRAEGETFHLEYPRWHQPPDPPDAGKLAAVLGAVRGLFNKPGPGAPPPTNYPDELRCFSGTAEYYGRDYYDCTPEAAASDQAFGEEAQPDTFYAGRAWDFVQGLKWTVGEPVSQAEVLRLNVDTYGSDGTRMGTSKLKAVVAIFRRAVAIPPGFPKIPDGEGRGPDDRSYVGTELGPGGSIYVWMTREGDVHHAMRDWTFAAPPFIPDSARIVPFEEAEREARRLLARSGPPVPVSDATRTSWGWRAVDGRLQPVYVFDFREGSSEGLHGMSRIEVPAVSPQ